MKNGTDSKKKNSKNPIAYFEGIGVLAGFIAECLFRMLSLEQMKYWLSNKTELRKRIREVFRIADEYVDVRDDWQKFYKTQFNWDVDFSSVIIPTCPGNGWRLIFIAKGLTLNKVFDSWTFKKWRYNNDLDSVVTKNIRTSENSYAVWVRDGIEPDQEFLGQSTRQADPNMLIGVTLLEHMIHETKYFAETGQHLDVKGATFCSGSRNSGGYVPSVYLGSAGHVNVHWYSLGNSNTQCAIRRVVS